MDWLHGGANFVCRSLLKLEGVHSRHCIAENDEDDFVNFGEGDFF